VRDTPKRNSIISHINRFRLDEKLKAWSDNIKLDDKLEAWSDHDKIENFVNFFHEENFYKKKLKR